MWIVTVICNDSRQETCLRQPNRFLEFQAGPAKDVKRHLELIFFLLNLHIFVTQHILRWEKKDLL